MVYKGIVARNRGTDDVPGRAKMIYKALRDVGLVLDHTDTFTLGEFNAKLAGTGQDSYNLKVTMNSDSVVTLAVNGITLGTLGWVNDGNVFLYYSPSDRWLAIFSGSTSSGKLVYFGKTHNNRYVGFLAGTETTNGYGLKFISESFNPGHLITGQLPCKLEVTENEETSNKWGERTIFITDSEDNLLMSGGDADYILGVDNPLMSMNVGHSEIAGHSIFRHPYYYGDNSRLILYTPLKISFQNEKNLIETQTYPVRAGLEAWSGNELICTINGINVTKKLQGMAITAVVYYENINYTSVLICSTDEEAVKIPSNGTTYTITYNDTTYYVLKQKGTNGNYSDSSVNSRVRINDITGESYSWSDDYGCPDAAINLLDYYFKVIPNESQEETN